MKIIAEQANKLLAREKFGVNVSVNLPLTSVLIQKEKLKEYGKLCKL